MPSYSGVWSLPAQMQAVAADNWPVSTYWINTLGNPPGYAAGRSVAIDSSGNLFICGYGYESTADEKVVLAKYSNSGKLQWQKTLNKSGTSSDTDQGYAVAVDSSGNPHVVGYWGTNTSAVYDSILAKYDTSGNVTWQRTLSGGTSSYDVLTGVTVDTSGNVYVVGNTGSSNNNIFIGKYNSSGSLQWQRTLSSAGEDLGYGVAIDSSANVYICGVSDTTGTLEFQLAKYDTNGTIQWQRRLGGNAAQDTAVSIAVDSSANVYVCGYSDATGAQDIQLAKYDTSGTIQWQRRLGGSGDDYGKGIALDSSGNIYICGDNGTSSGAQIAKYNNSGTLQWQTTLSTSGAYVYGNKIVLDSTGNIYVAGTTDLTYGMFLAKLPGDGSLTGTYGSFVYATSSLTSATSTLTAATSSLTSATSSLTDSAATSTNANGVYTANRISVT